MSQQLQGKPDWPEVRERYEAFWQGEVTDRPLIKVTAPMPGSSPAETPPLDAEDLKGWFTDPDRVIPRLLRQVENTYFGGDAFPLLLPVAGNMVAIQAAYHGCPYRLMPVANSAWADPIIEDWSGRELIGHDPENWWWKASQRLLARGAEAAVGRAAVGIPDLQGDGEIVARLRGTSELAMDCIEHPDEVRRAVHEVNVAWLQYYRECNEIIHRCVPGYVDNLGVYSDRPMVTLECDFSCMISAAMFDDLFLPGIARQSEWVERTIYHLDGPGAVQHLDSLLGLGSLDGIQWQPGVAGRPMTRWIPLLKRVQEGGKVLVIGCEDWEVEVLLKELSPKGLLISTSCPTPAEADALVERAARLLAGG